MDSNDVPLAVNPEADASIKYRQPITGSWVSSPGSRGHSDGARSLPPSYDECQKMAEKLPEKLPIDDMEDYNYEYLGSKRLGPQHIGNN